MSPRRRRAIIWTAIVLAWGLVLLDLSGPNVPGASSIPYEDVYAELSAADQAKVYPKRNYALPSDRRWVPPSERTASTFVTLSNDPDGGLLLRDGVSDGLTVATHFDEILHRRLSGARLRFRLVILALWVSSTASFFAFGWLLVVVRKLARPEQWHPGQLVLAWLGASAFEFALFVGIRSGAGSTLALVGVVPFIGTPVGMFVFTWIWFGSRKATA